MISSIIYDNTNETARVLLLVIAVVGFIALHIDAFFMQLCYTKVFVKSKLSKFIHEVNM